MEGASHLLIKHLSHAKACAHSTQFIDKDSKAQRRKVTCQSAWKVGFPPRSLAFWTEGGVAQAKPVLVVETAHWDGQGRKVTCPPSTGHMTQDPWDPSQWPRDMASMALLSQDMMFH